MFACAERSAEAGDSGHYRLLPPLARDSITISVKTVRVARLDVVLVSDVGAVEVTTGR